MTDVPDAFKKGMEHLPSLPPKTTIAFKCRECGCIWTFGIEEPISFEMFYEKNKECYSCHKITVDIDIVVPPPRVLE